MTRRYTGAEALALKAAATQGEWGVMSDEGPVRLPSGERVGGWMHSICAGSGFLMDEGHVCIGHAFTKADGMPAHDARLIAAAPDLADSLAAVEAERDEAIAQLRADDSPSRRPCGDNSCVLRGPGPHGMGTNGGCRCPAGLLRSRYRVLRAERDALRANVRKLAPIIEAIYRASETQRALGEAASKTDAAHRAGADTAPVFKMEELMHAALFLSADAMKDRVCAMSDEECAALAALREAVPG